MPVRGGVVDCRSGAGGASIIRRFDEEPRPMGIDLEPFALERWMPTYEMQVSHDIAESGIQPMSVVDLLAFESEADRERLLAALLEMPLGYGEARGTETLRSALAATYRDLSPEAVLVTT